jgi:L-fuconolactonase
MTRIDSHQHFWIYDPVRDAWIDDTMSAIKKDFLPDDVKPLLDENNIDGCVAVQADQSENETHYLLDLKKKYDFIKGVVGWVDLRAENIEERLEYFSQFEALKGFRHIVQSEPQDDYLLRPDFCRGISLLAKYNFTYDILIYPEHLKYALEFVQKFPDQKFVIDHIAKPYIKERLIDEWQADLEPFSSYENVYCKMAGLVTEADWSDWKASDFKPYIDVVLDIFGIDRVMFGSDWPVCLTSASYRQVCEAVADNTLSLSAGEKDKLWGKNCIDFYRLYTA